MEIENETKKEYFELLGFESVGSDPARLRDCVQCAAWLEKWLERIGFKAELLSPDIKDGKAAPPVFFAERPGDEGAARVLYYGHYDVQPPDPLDEWETPPFTPTEKDARVYCRGAQDDKGQLFAFLCGIRDFLAKPGPKPTIKIVLEGQEESGSGALAEMAAGMRRRLAADVMLVCDTNAAEDLRPAIVAGLRGVSHFTIRLTGADRDLHSGEYGGLAPNVAQGMAALVASLHAADGSIAVEGFRAGIEPPHPDELRLAESFSKSPADYEAEIGCSPAGGQKGLSPAQRLSFEPTIEVNGLHSGYGGPGAKTVIPREAIAKISMRLVPGQSPTAAFAAVKRHLEERVPEGTSLSFDEFSPGAVGFRLPVASPLFRLAAHVLEEMDGRTPAFVWSGASIPVVSVLREASGAAPLIVGWGQPEDRIHSPNESYSLRQFAKAREWAVAILSAL
jgi:succinyl-diaminopimelate desuccinylase